LAASGFGQQAIDPDRSHALLVEQAVGGIEQPLPDVRHHCFCAVFSHA